MSEKLNEIKPFKQIPYCEENTLLTITGAEYETLRNSVNMIRESAEAINSIFVRNLNEGNILVKYVQQDGTEISEQEAIDYLKKASEYLKENSKDEEKAPD